MSERCKHGTPLDTPCVDCGGVRRSEPAMMERRELERLAWALRNGNLGRVDRHRVADMLVRRAVEAGQPELVDSLMEQVRELRAAARATLAIASEIVDWAIECDILDDGEGDKLLARWNHDAFKLRGLLD